MAIEDGHERKLAVIVHADVVGSTDLVHRDETLAHQRITQAFRLLSETIASYRGTVHEIRGDALVAEFPGASDAVSAALAFQQLNAAQNNTFLDDVTPSLRVGISLGEVVIADDTVTGPGVVLAQPVEQLAQPGGICATAAVYEAAPERLPFDYLDLGRQAAKGFDEPVHVYAVALKSDAPMPAPEPSAPAAPHLAAERRRYWFSGAMAALLLVIGGLLGWLQPWQPDVDPAIPEKMAFALPDEPSIAVLPFDDLSGDGSKQPLLDRLTSTLIAALAVAPRMFVVATESTTSYRGENVKPGTVAEELGVRYVLKGGVQWAGEQMRVTVQLIDAIDGKFVWSERYDRQVKDVFQVQDDIVKHILAEAEGKLVWEGWPAIWAGMTDNLAAYLHYLQGQKALFKFTEADNRVAQEHAEKAISIDPDFAPGWNLRGWAEYHAGIRGWGDPSKPARLRVAEQHAGKAIALAPRYGSPRGLLATVMTARDDHPGAVAICQEAVSVAPNESIALATCSGMLAASGEAEQAITLIDRATRLSPRHPTWYP